VSESIIPEGLTGLEVYLDHLFRGLGGWAVAFSGCQASLDDPEAPSNL